MRLGVKGPLVNILFLLPQQADAPEDSLEEVEAEEALHHREGAEAEGEVAAAW